MGLRLGGVLIVVEDRVGSEGEGRYDWVICGPVLVWLLRVETAWSSACILALSCQRAYHDALS